MGQPYPDLECDSPSLGCGLRLPLEQSDPPGRAMCTPAVHHRLPRAGVDTIGCGQTALLTLAMAIQQPLRAETVMLLLDDKRRGIAVAVVSGTNRPDDVLEVVECLTRGSAHGGRVGSIVVASVRP